MDALSLGRRRAGFTTTDALILVAVGLLLVALTVPLFQATSERHAQRICRARLGRIGEALLAYTAANAGYLPPSDGPWFRLLEDGGFIRRRFDEPIFQCPASPRAEIGYGYNYKFPDRNLWGGSVPLAAALNPIATLIVSDCGYIGPRPSRNPLEWREESYSVHHGAMVTPGRADETGYALGRDFNGRPIVPGPKGPQGEPGFGSSWRPVGRHRGAVQCLFLDGHVDAIPLPQLVGPDGLAALFFQAEPSPASSDERDKSRR